MKNLVKYIAISCVLFSFSTAKAEEKWYTNGFAGVNFEKDKNHNQALDPGFIVGYSLGRRLGTHFRYEGEVAYRENKGNYPSDNLPRHISTFTASSLFRQGNAMANGILDILPGSFANPYVGLGAGGFYSKEVTKYGGGSYYSLQGTHYKIVKGYAAQEIVGISINPLWNTEIGAEYRSTHNLKFTNQSNSLALNCGFKF